jgi:predicted nucleotidyltransferase
MGNEKIEKVVKIIKEEIEARGLKVVKIILFGSRAKGNQKEDKLTQYSIDARYPEEFYLPDIREAK